MSRKIQFTIAQYDVVRGDPIANLQRIRGFSMEASTLGSKLLCLPEMATTGFDWNKNRKLLEGSKDYLGQVAALAKEHNIAICGSFLEQTESGRPANTAYYFDSCGSIVAKYRKIHLFTLFQEDKHVEPGSQFVVADTSLGRTGFSICYDLRFPELFRRNAELGAVVQMLPAAFPHPRLEHWQILVRARAIENQCFLIAVNQCGTEGHGDKVGNIQYFGHSMVVDPWGNLCAEADEAECLLTVEIDLELVSKTRKQLSAFDDRRPELF